MEGIIAKKRWTRQDDELIIKLAKEGKDTEETAIVLGRSGASVAYRISRVLNAPGVESLDDIRYITEEEFNDKCGKEN